MGGTLSQPNITKKFQQGQNTQLKFCTIQMQGWQKQMQNHTISKINIDPNTKNGNSLFAVFDGYRGYEVSLFLKQTFLSVLVNTESYIQGNYQQALIDTFQKIDQLLKSQKGQKRLQQYKTQNGIETRYQHQKISDIVGCEAAVILITKKKFIVANVGNVRAYLYRDKLVELTKAHTLEQIQQKTRIQKAGGVVTSGRINGNIQLSRSFGLFSYKKQQTFPWTQQIVTCYPQIKTIQRSISDSFIFIGCNGIFQKQKQKQSKFIMQKIKNSQNFQNKQYKECLQNILSQTIARSYHSQNSYGFRNMSGILIKFHQI